MLGGSDLWRRLVCTDQMLGSTDWVRRMSVYPWRRSDQGQKRAQGPRTKRRIVTLRRK